jgi:hypothetical protein
MATKRTYSMWDEQQQSRLIHLQAAKEQDALSKSGSIELRKLTDDRLRLEAEALTDATRKMDIETEQTRTIVKEVDAQKLALEEMIREQEAYLADIGMEAYQS